jgi:hypothetical protein
MPGNTLPPALQAAQQRAAQERGDPLPVDLLDLDEALEEVAVGTAIASLEAQVKAQQPAVPTPLTLERTAQTALMRWLKENNLLQTKALPLPVDTATITIHNTQRLWGREHWDYFQRVVGEHTEHGQTPRCGNNANEIMFWWEKLQDCNGWIAWAKALRTKALERYPAITITIDVEL